MSAGEKVPPLPQEPAPNLVEVADLNQFVTMLTAWHSTKVALLKHMLNVPEGTLTAFDEENYVSLSGDLRAGYQAGLTIALSELGTLPFLAELEQEDSPEPVKESGDAAGQ